jgi:hypothetical protein
VVISNHAMFRYCERVLELSEREARVLCRPCGPIKHEIRKELLVAVESAGPYKKQKVNRRARCRVASDSALFILDKGKCMTVLKL